MNKKFYSHLYDIASKIECNLPKNSLNFVEKAYFKIPTYDNPISHEKKGKATLHVLISPTALLQGILSRLVLPWQKA